MLKLRVLTPLLILLFPLFSLAQDTVYYNTIWKETTKDKADYYRIKTKTADGWLVKDCFLSGKPQMTGGYADDSLQVSQGRFVWYTEKGVPTHSCIYVQGKLEGADTLFYPNGHRREVGVNKAGEKEGEWVGYYPSGAVAAKVKYEQGKQVSASFFNEDGSANKKIKEFEKEAEYPGGVPQLLRFLNKNLQYPDAALKSLIEGTVVVQFKISKEGQMSEFKVVQSIDKSLDNEALRVLKMMPDWQPAILGGVPADSYFKQPVQFDLRSVENK